MGKAWMTRKFDTKTFEQLEEIFEGKDELEVEKKYIELRGCKPDNIYCLPNSYEEILMAEIKKSPLYTPIKQQDTLDLDVDWD